MLQEEAVFSSVRLLLHKTHKHIINVCCIRTNSYKVYPSLSKKSSISWTFLLIWVKLSKPVPTRRSLMPRADGESKGRREGRLKKPSDDDDEPPMRSKKRKRQHLPKEAISSEEMQDSYGHEKRN